MGEDSGGPSEHTVVWGAVCDLPSGAEPEQYVYVEKKGKKRVASSVFN